MSESMSSKLNGILTYTEKYDLTDFKFTWYLSGNTKLAQYISKNYFGEIINVNLELKTDELYLDYILSRTSMDPLAFDLATDNEKIMLKGLPHKTLCFIIDYISKKIRKFDKVFLEAAPYLGKEIKGRSPVNLILYYKRLGFGISEDETEDYTKLKYNSEQSIQMEGETENIIKVCSSIFTTPLSENDILIQKK